ncbi:mannosyltransferase family protein [Acidipropionibacterium jensenii]|uniref:mannosyltransferase family protein n=1 Tax=Acidipropionibacterium jensenii TaxID=1749 RepID=UPI00214B6A21|nr:mannosyltransferase family protein [Acidipropionibacterium jensenii]
MPADDLGLVLRTWLGSRALLAGVLVVVALTRYGFTAAISNWDVQHFMTIARNGYADSLEMAFFPGLPMLMRAGALVGIPMPVTGAVLALICSLLAALALYRIGGTVPACLWLIAPTAVFTTVGYTEAPFCAAAFWAWERARAGRWWPAAGLAALACTLRVSGLFLVGALAVMAVLGDGQWRDGRAGMVARPIDRRPPAIAARLATLVLPLAVLAAYLVYLHRLTGSWTAWFQAQDRGWGRGFTTPLESWRNTVPATSTSAWQSVYGADAAMVALVFRLEILAMVAGCAVTLYCLVRRRWASASWVGIQVLAFSIGHWFMSVNRAVLLWFPLFIAIGELTRGPSRPVGLKLFWRWLVLIAVVIDLGVMVWWGWLFYSGKWSS